MSRIFAFFILLFITGLALAAVTPIDISQAMHQSFNPPPTDYSVAYLSQIFGTVGNVLQGMSGQMMGHLFAIFNKGVMVVAAIWLGYTTLTISLRGAQEGSFMGQNRNVPVLLLRIALGFALIIPSSATGYSLLQDLFMKIVVQGVGLADYGWNVALNYMQLGGALYIPPETLNNDSGMITAAITGSAASGSTLAPVTQILQDEACMVESDRWETQMLAYQPKTTSGGSLLSWVRNQAGETNLVGPYHPVLDRKNGMIYFPGVGNSSSDKITKDNAKCGYVTSYFATQFPSYTTEHSGYSNQQYQAMQTYSWGALEQLVNGLLPAAKLYTDKIYSAFPDSYSDCTKNTTCISVQQEINNDVFSAILGYANLITPYQKIVENNAGNSNFGFIDTAKQEGWIMAGSFFWAIEQANQHSSTISISNLFPVVTPANKNIFDFNVNPFPSSFLDAAADYVKASASDLSVLWSTYVATQTNASAQSAAGNFSTGNSFVDIILSMLTQNMSGVNSYFILGTSSYNPIVALMHEGHLMLQIAIGIWLYALLASVAIGLVVGICQSTSPGPTAYHGLLVWAKAIVSAICLALIVPGFILSYYVPIYPFAVFMFAAVGWMALVIEGVAAAPLVCMGLTHPENHDFLGSSQQALMLVLSIFVRPILMVIGLIVAMIVSFVAFRMLGSGYSIVFSDLFSSSANYSLLGALASFSPVNIILALFTMLMMYVIFGFMSMQIIEQSYKLIYQLPNNVTQWIGGPQTGQDFGQMAAGLQGVVSGTGSQVSSAQQQAGQATQHGRERAEDKQEKGKAQESAISGESKEK